MNSKELIVGVGIIITLIPISIILLRLNNYYKSSLTTGKTKSAGITFASLIIFGYYIFLVLLSYLLAQWFPVAVAIGYLLSLCAGLAIFLFLISLTITVLFQLCHWVKMQWLT